jgi:pyruvate,water dikinase
VRRLLPFDSSDRAMAEFVYLRAAPSPVTWSFRRLPALLLGAVVWYLVLAVLLARTRGMPDDFMHSYRSLCRRIDEDATFGPRESLERLWLRPGLFEPVGDMALLVNATFFRLVPWMAALEAMLRRWVAQMPADAAALLSSGTAGILSAEMGREIELLAREARRSPAVARLFAVSSQPEELLPRLRKEPAAQPFLAGLERFLAVHGHRAAKEFELRSPRWAEDPAPVVAMIRNYVAAPAEPAVDRDKAAHARTELEAVIRNALAGRPFERRFRVRWRLIRAAAGKVRYYLKLRENSRFYHIMALGIVRRKILQIEEELLRDRKLKCRDDIFFLRMREIEALRAGPSEGAALDARIRTRRLKHVKLSKAPAPMTIGIAPPEVSAETAGNRLHGQGASPGRHVGRARVIMDPAVEATLEPGEVLVAPYTDPAWTPLFLTAGAAVVEVGSYLSHAGTVAREYAMPCVVDVADCTRLIRTGMRVEVDADRGIVSILDGGST